VTVEHALLTRIEELESRTLSWCLVDGGISPEELEKLADEAIASTDASHSFLDGAELVDELIRRRLVFGFDIPNGRIFRTRMGEGVRLLSRLRQMFPKHLSHNAWMLAPTLVSDFRFLHRPRRYPIRDVEQSRFLGRMADHFSDPTATMLLTSLTDRFSNGYEERLSEFQVQSAIRILQGAQKKPSHGTVVSAGTGSGKTLAFYIPALAVIGGLVDSDRWTKALSIYPRRELLKDQFSETFKVCRTVDAALASVNRRAITIGAYFGDTPKNASAVKEGKWQTQSAGWICPFLRCPRCDGTMVWRNEDVTAGVERLYCQDAKCSGNAPPETIVLTREKLEKAPPDVLFTTTEMMNRKMSDSRARAAFGLGVKPKWRPRLLLLDEIHTYEGTSGAQVAFLLRRLRHSVGEGVDFVGLSATLREAQAFFSMLTGIPEKRVAVIEPRTTELVEEGREYLIALRGDPVSGASLLSTSIQTAMLLRRLQDPHDKEISRGFYGKKVFVFTDDLDVTNRMFHNILDAEGLNSRGAPLPPAKRPHGSLANLRSSTHPARMERFIHGQSWDVVEEIGFSLLPAQHLTIGRTSSQDTGVQERGDVIVATAALEVGFNDPAVAAILQHKAPREGAQFIQRMGRAGRTREMRPWTVVVLSDYGRDRFAYQGYELLFDPVLAPRTLPLGNRYVLRMQMVFAFMDWATEKLSTYGKGSVWDDLTRPAWGEVGKRRQGALADLIEQILSDEPLRDELLTYISDSLWITVEEATVLFWEPPRSLLLEVLPTALRRLRTAWRQRTADGGSKEGGDFQSPTSPLPDFVPTALFSDLALPEIKIDLGTPSPSAMEEQSMPVLQGMKEFAPGRVSRRFGVQHRGVSHWIPIPAGDLGDEQVMEVGEIADFATSLGRVKADDDEQLTEISCHRIWRIKPSVPPPTVLETSNSLLDWRTQVVSDREGAAADVPAGSGWENVVRSVSFHTHNLGNPLEVRRFAIGTRAEIRQRHGKSSEGYVRFMDSDPLFGGRTQTSIGFVLDVDGLRVDIEVPKPVGYDEPSGPRVWAMRAAYMWWRVNEDVALQDRANVFMKGWLHQVYSSALTRIALEKRCLLQEAVDLLHNGDTTAMFREVLDVVFQTLLTEEDDDPQNQRLYDEILSLLGDEFVLERLKALSPALWADPSDTSVQDWLASRFAATLGSALLSASQSLCPELDLSQLIMDRHRLSGSDEGFRIWITEITVGGAGMIEQLLDRYSEDPRRFYDLVQAALGPNDFEIIDHEFKKIVALASKDEEVAASLTTVRSSESQKGRVESSQALRETLQRKGVALSHPVIAAMNSRLLRPGSNQALDRLLHDLVESWTKSEERLGVEVDSRVFAYVMSESDQIEKALGSAGSGPSDHRRRWRFSALHGLLWPRGYQISTSSLRSYNPYAPAELPDRHVIMNAVGSDVPRIDLADETWLKSVLSALSSGGAVEIMVGSDNLHQLRTVLMTLTASPVDVGYLLLYPRVDGLSIDGETSIASLSLREFVQ
jgi:hypothetical protein